VAAKVRVSAAFLAAVACRLVPQRSSHMKAACMLAAFYAAVMSQVVWRMLLMRSVLPVKWHSFVLSFFFLNQSIIQI
jgi:hypothetical protein